MCTFSETLLPSNISGACNQGKVMLATHAAQTLHQVASLHQKQKKQLVLAMYAGVPALALLVETKVLHTHPAMSA